MTARVAMPRPSRLYKRDLAIREKALGPDHPDSRHLTQQPGRALLCATRWARAAEYWRRSTAHRRTPLTAGNGRCRPSSDGKEKG